MSLPRPGLVGITIRLGLASAVGYLGYSAIAGARGFFDGIGPGAAAGYLIPLVLLSSWVVNELVQKPWGWRPALLLSTGAAATLAIGAVQGDAWGPLFGTYLWAWTVAFALLLGPAHLLAALLRTPGCEMRAYAHLWTRLRGGSPDTVACPGWIDRFDGIRVLGRW